MRFPRPRVCTVPTVWHGFQLYPGYIFGRDNLGLFVAPPFSTGGVMRFSRIHPVLGTWVDVITPTQNPTAKLIQSMVSLKPWAEYRAPRDSALEDWQSFKRDCKPRRNPTPQFMEEAARYYKPKRATRSFPTKEGKV